MELINQSALPALLFVSELSGGRRIGTVVAKATVRSVGHSADVALDTQSPLPIFEVDTDSDLGVLPCDVAARFDPGVDVLLHGAAYPHDTTGIADVTLTVADITQRMMVFGDRFVDPGGRPEDASEPLPFKRMPLTWAHALGGRADVWIDSKTVVPTRHFANPHGKGFDVGEAARHLRSGLGVAEGFPRFETRRQLPNLTHPDDPLGLSTPVCWAASPPDVLIPPTSSTSTPRLSRAYPYWRDLALTFPLDIALTGCEPGGGRWDARLPRIDIAVDYVRGSRTGSLELWPSTLLLLPEERAVAITYVRSFQFTADPSDERSLRLVVT